MCGLRERDTNDIVDAVKKFPEITKAVIFGSRATGNYKDGSDVDIAIKGDKITRETVTRLGAFLNEELPLPYFFDIVHYEKINNKELIKHIDEEGKAVYVKKV